MAKKSTSKKKRPKRSTKRPRARIDTQDDLPGLEAPKIPAIEKKAKKLYEVRAERMILTSEESTLAIGLLALMQEHKLKFYECRTFDGKVTVKHGEDKVSVKVKAERDESESVSVSSNGKARDDDPEDGDGENEGD